MTVHEVLVLSILDDEGLLLALEEAEKEEVASGVEAGVALRARAKASELRAELLYRRARTEGAEPPQGGRDAGKNVLSARVSDIFMKRVEGLTRALGDEPATFFRRALLLEADRVERELLAEEKDEGRDDIKKHQGKRRRAKAWQQR